MAEALDAEWFLVANKDKLSIKIRGQVTLGEDDRGLLTLESRKDAERWFTLSVDTQDALVVSDLGPQWELENPGVWVSQQPGVVCIPGTLLSLPNNEVYISHNLMRGKVQQRLVVRRAEGQNRVEPEAEIVVAEPLEHQDDIADEPEELLITSLPPGAPVEVPREHASEIPTLTVSPDGAADVAIEEAQKARGGRAKIALAGVALLGLASAGYFYWHLPQNNPTDRVAVSAPLEQVEEITPIVDKARVNDVLADEAGKAGKEEVVASPAPALSQPQPTKPSESSVESVTGTAVIPEGIEKDWQQEISEARFLMSRGFINYPERNTVSILGEVLTAAPDHAEAWQLLNQATDVYLADALQAHADGFTDAAREMVLEVERFHPNYARLDRVKSALGLN